VEEHRSKKSELLKIGALAKKADVAVGTVRYYESLGLLEPAQRSKSGYRYYTVETIKRIRFIKKAQLLNFSLFDIREILNIREQGYSACSIVKDLLNRKIVELDEQLHQIHTLKAELEAYRERWISRPLDDPHGQELCSMIEEVYDTSLSEQLLEDVFKVAIKTRTIL
jgi:DNA-binding transcriptional MerR regulator